MTGAITWYATRGAGIVALLLLTGTVVLGLLVALRWMRPGVPRFLTAQVHRSVGLLATVFLVVHVVTAVLDPFTALGPIAALIPFSASYRPFWLGLGVVGVDLLLAITVTSLIRARLGYRAWRAVHWLAYAAWPLAMLHGIGAGTDSTTPWAWAVYAVCASAVAGVVTWRVQAAVARRDSASDHPIGRAARPAGRTVADALQFGPRS